MGHHHPHPSEQNLRTAFFLNLAFTLVELVGGFWVNSVAILSDAIHDLGDSLSLGTSWYLEKLAKKKPDSRYSFGYRRFSLLGALINSVVLILGSIWVIREAIFRIMEPETSDAKGMIGLALLGIAVNGYAAWKVVHGKTLNERVISWHLLEDVLGWAAILVAAVLMLFVNWPFIDPVLSLIITLFILWNVAKRLRETLFLFLQGQPKDVNKAEIEAKILEINSVDSLHQTHIWSLDGEHHVFTTHVKLSAEISSGEILTVKNSIRKILAEYPFVHYTIETESADEVCELIKK